MRRISATLVLAALVAQPGSSQAVKPPEFEAASVKVSSKQRARKPGLAAEIQAFKGGPGTPDPSRITYTGVSLKMLLGRAFHYRPYQVEGPDWLDFDPYDIVATMPPDTDQERFSLMLQNLLVTQFQIHLHLKTQSFPIYVLTIGKDGPKLKPPETKSASGLGDDSAGLREKTMADLAATMRNAGSNPGLSLNLPDATLAKFAAALSFRLDRPVRDMTGLSGSYSFFLHWVSESDPLGSREKHLGLEEAVGPPLFAAVQQQLGLKLESSKGPVEILVVDRAERKPLGN